MCTGNKALAYAYGQPTARGRLRRSPEDFQVDERLGFEPDGEGSHAFLRIRKRGLNTQWVASRLAELAGVRPVDVGFSGLKDRNALTTQWFSVNLSGKDEPEWETLNSGELLVLAVTRHGRKLRRGSHGCNHFLLMLRDLEGDTAELENRLKAMITDGIPNYFGEQRFGKGGGNLPRAAAMFAGEIRVRARHKRGLYLSAARSMLFNRVLSQRVTDGAWNRPLAGDVMMLDGSHSIFALGEVNAEIETRIALGDIHPTGPLWGRGESLVANGVRALETRALEGCGEWCEGLERAGLKQERRALRVNTADISWEEQGKSDLRLEFTLPRGAYATVVVRELLGPFE